MRYAIKILFIIIVLTIKNIYAQESIIPGEKLKDDLHQLINIIESSHPDPYLNGGGKIAFFRRYQKALNSVPSEGLTKKDFYDLVLPIVAGIGDSHTGLVPLKQAAYDPGLPFRFKTVEKSLFVNSVPGDKYLNLLGAELVSVEGVTVKQLVERQGTLRGTENDYTRLAFLMYRTLPTMDGLKAILPEWKNYNSINLCFKDKNGKTSKLNLPLPVTENKPVKAKSKVDIPPTEKSDFVYSFLDKNKKTAFLIIKDMSNYREGFENLKSKNFEGIEQMAAECFKKYNKEAVPDDWNMLIKGIPSAAEIFISLINDMKKYKTVNLVIDLRENTGGNSVMKEILVYLLYGEKTMKSIVNGYSIKKYSDLYFNQYKTDEKEKIEQSGIYYDFSGEEAYRTKIGYSESIENLLKTIPSFWNIYKSGMYGNPTATLKNVIVLSSPLTYSSGFNLLTDLVQAGAKTLGTPSGQAPNNFGDVIPFALKNSELKGYVSFKNVLTFPDSTEKGNCLIPDYPMTIKKYMQFNCDPNSEILMALEILNLPRN